MRGGIRTPDPRFRKSKQGRATVFSTAARSRSLSCQVRSRNPCICSNPTPKSKQRLVRHDDAGVVYNSVTKEHMTFVAAAYSADFIQNHGPEEATRPHYSATIVKLRPYILTSALPGKGAAVNKSSSDYVAQVGEIRLFRKIRTCSWSKSVSKTGSNVHTLFTRGVLWSEKGFLRPA